MNAQPEPAPVQEPPLSKWHQRFRKIRRSRAVCLGLLVLLCLCYYGSYYRYGINFKDEGGTVALGAKRLLAGERPFKDVGLNYNVLWFYPVVGLFKVFGVSFVVLRIYCFALSTLTVILTFLAVDEVSRRRWVAFTVALLPLLVPGMTFKNYIPLLVVANAYCLLRVALAAPAATNARRTHFLKAIGGLVLGLTFLIRIDLGIFFSALWVGLVGLRLLDRSIVSFGERLLVAAKGLALLVSAVLLVHLPVYADARARGFDHEFVGQYPAFANLIWQPFRRSTLAAAQAAPKTAQASTTALQTSELRSPEGKPSAKSRLTLRRGALGDYLAAKDFKGRSMVILTYLPLISIGVLFCWALLNLIRSAFSPNPLATRLPLAALLMLGSALTAFPQFFFFRPDAPHLSEFSPGFWVGTVCATLCLGAHQGTWLNRWRARFLLIFLALHAALYLSRTLPDRWTGTIAARNDRTKFFKAENGVNVYVTNKEYGALTSILKIIREHSTPADYLVAYPYHPSFNLLSDRPTYEVDVYVDNATRTKNWDAEAIARFEKYQPAVIILSDWAINGVDASRFSVWAAPTKNWVQNHYTFQGSFLDGYEVYTRPEPAL